MLYWRLSSFYWFYFGMLGAVLPYWTLYLQTKGYDTQTIGQLMAIMTATRIIAPNIWSWIADHTGHRIILIRLSSLFATLCFLGVFIADDFWELALVLSTHSFFWNAALPQIEATTFTYLGSRAHRYTQIRVWGSIGFITFSVGLGILFTKQPVTWLPVILTGLLVGIWLTTLFIPSQARLLPKLTHQSLRHVLRQPTVIALLCVCLLMQVSHGPYYAFYSIYLEDHGFNRNVIGQLWALGVIAEVGAFLVMHRVLTRFSLQHLLLWSLGLTGLRWVLIAYCPWLTALFLAQLLHAASFGLFHAVAIQFIHQYFPGHLQGRGQALYSSLSFGVGGALGSLAGGYTWKNMGSQDSFLLAAGVCCMALWISYQWVTSERK